MQCSVSWKKRRKKRRMIVKSGTISQLAATVLVSPGFSPRRSMLLPTRGAVDGSSLGRCEWYFAFFPTVGTGSLSHCSWRARVSVSHVSSLHSIGCTAILSRVEELMYDPDTQKRPDKPFGSSGTTILFWDYNLVPISKPNEVDKIIIEKRGEE